MLPVSWSVSNVAVEEFWPTLPCRTALTRWHLWIFKHWTACSSPATTSQLGLVLDLTSNVLLFSHFQADLIACFRSLSCCMTQLRFSFSTQTDGLTFSCRVLWYRAEFNPKQTSLKQPVIVCKGALTFYTQGNWVLHNFTNNTTNIYLFVNSGSLYLILGFGWRSDNIQFPPKMRENQKGVKYFFTALCMWFSIQSFLSE